MKKILIIFFVITILICFLLIKDIKEHFNFEKITQTEINKFKKDEKLFSILERIVNNQKYHEDRINKTELKLHQTY